MITDSRVKTKAQRAKELKNKFETFMLDSAELCDYSDSLLDMTKEELKEHNDFVKEIANRFIDYKFIIRGLEKIIKKGEEDE